MKQNLILFLAAAVLLALGPPVIGGVKSRAFVDHRNSVEQALACAGTQRTGAVASLTEALAQLKLVSTTGASVVVARH